MTKWVIGVAIIASACTINGKSYGPGSTSSKASSSDASSSSGSSGSTSSNSSSSSSGGGSTLKKGHQPYPTGLADPWVGVQGDQPKRWTAEAVDERRVRDDAYDCTAKFDHCLVKDAWFIVRDRDVERYMPAQSWWTVFSEKGIPSGGSNVVSDDEAFTAFRTVPATKTNIKPGYAVVALSREEGKLKSEHDSANSFWYYGFVEEVDVDGGFFTIKNRADSFKLWSARVIVMQYKKGGKVEMANGFQKNNMAVKASDVYLPE